MWKLTNAKYYCNFCIQHANKDLQVFSITQTILYQELNEKNMVNICANCLKTEMLLVAAGTGANLIRLRNMILQRIPDFSEEYINKTASIKIMCKLRVNSGKRLNDMSNAENSMPKRQKLDLESSRESGNTTTLAPVRGTIVGGGKFSYIDLRFI